MTTSPETGSLARRMVVAGVCVALLAQMSLPALHAVATERHSQGIQAGHILSSDAPILSRATQASASHDPATCSICQSLMRTSPVATLSVSRGEPSPKGIPALPAAPECTHSAVARSGHTPRAPPTHASHLG